MTNKNTRRGFTLIELLVVVLIIGILAAVAVPQYRKTVKKAHLTEYFLYLDSLYKGMDVWLLANGEPETALRFSGEDPKMILDIDMPFTKNIGNHSYTKFGRLNGGCGNGYCWVDLATSYDDYNGPLTKGSIIYTTKKALAQTTKQLLLSEVPNDTQDRKLVCEWWATHYGKEQMYDAVKTKCATVGI